MNWQQYLLLFLLGGLGATIIDVTPESLSGIAIALAMTIAYGAGMCHRD